MRQRQTPLADALDQQRINRLAHFDVPAHKSGRGNPELTDYLGARAMAMDVNSMKPLDNLAHPVSVIKEAQQLAAEAFGERPLLDAEAHVRVLQLLKRRELAPRIAVGASGQDRREDRTGK